MRKMITSIAAILAVSALMVGAASAADKLVVKGTDGTTDVFKVADDGSIVVSGGLRWDAANKRLGLFTSSPLASLHVSENTTSGTRGFLSAQHNDGAQAAYLLFRKSRGSETIPAIVTSGDFTGFVDVQGYDGKNYLNSASFGFVVDSTPTNPGSTSYLPTDSAYPGKVPMAYVVYTGYKIGNPGRAERFRVGSDGRMRLSNQPTAPANNATCTVGDMILDAPNGFLYLCTATDSWKRTSFVSY